MKNNVRNKLLIVPERRIPICALGLSILCVLVLAQACTLTWAQTGVIKGRVFNQVNNSPIDSVQLLIQGTAIGVRSDTEGRFEIENLEPGLYNLEVSASRFKKKVVYEIQVFKDKPAFVDVGLNEETIALEMVEVVSSTFRKTAESPLSMRRVGLSEIIRTPGGNRDVAKTIQTLPGVASDGFSNNLIIRGGASGENSYFLDGISVPTINHFTTQGNAGGVWGAINANFIREVDFYAGAFPVNRGDALSGVLDFTLRNGNPDRLEISGVAGSTDVGLTLEGPIGEKSTFIATVKRAYIGNLIKALGFSFVPTYTDAMLKFHLPFNEKNELSILGFGTNDDFALNLDADLDGTNGDLNRFVLSAVPEVNQQTYVVGARYRHFTQNGYQTAVVSRNFLRNEEIKYFNNDASDLDNLLRDYVADEVESKVRVENAYFNGGFQFNTGAGLQNVIYKNNTNNKGALPDGTITRRIYNTDLNFNRFSLFTSASLRLFDDKLIPALGIRTDFSDYSSEMDSPVDQLSPRFSLAYNLTSNLSLNFNAGRYHQLPPYILMGFQNNDGTFVNKDNGITYMRSDHLVAGTEYNTDTHLKLTAEGFYKRYDNYPVLLTDGISLANRSATEISWAVGDEPADSTGEGRAYGVEISANQKLRKGFFGIFAYTFARSEFLDKNREYRSSSWDYKHFLNLTAGKKFRGNWEFGAKFRLAGGTPFTPYDLETSALKAVWDAEGTGLLDYDRLNADRTNMVHQLDIRVDKRFFFDGWSLNFYVDLQNVYNSQIGLPPFLIAETDANGNPIQDPKNPDAYLLRTVDNLLPPFVPAIGVIAEF